MPIERLADKPIEVNVNNETTKLLVSMQMFDLDGNERNEIRRVPVNTLKGLMDDEEKTDWQLIEDISLTEAVQQIDIPHEKLQGLKELHISAYIVPTDISVTSQDVTLGISGKTYWTGKANPKATGTLKVVMDIYISPRRTLIFDGTVSAYDYTLSGTSYKGTGYFRDANMDYAGFYDLGSADDDIWMRTTSANPMAAGTKIKVWGR